MERLQRVMAARGAGSRRSAEQLIRAGRVMVDGQVVTQLGTKVDPDTADIRVDGKALRKQRPRYILLNKPRSYITTTSDERDRRTVMDLVDVRERIYPVGRLDRDTEGLLLLTNDGDVANRVMHPRYELDKEYHVLTLTRPDDRTLQRVRDGVTIDGRRIVPKEFRILRETRDGLILRIVIHEGLYHAVRRIMDEVGIPVQRLRRVRIGPLSVLGIPLGTWRDLTAGELNQLFQALRLDPDRSQGQTPGSREKRFARDRTEAADRQRALRPSARPGSARGSRQTRSAPTSRTQPSHRSSQEGAHPSDGKGARQPKPFRDGGRRRPSAPRRHEESSEPGRAPLGGGDRRAGRGRQDNRRPRPRRSPRRDSL